MAEDSGTEMKFMEVRQLRWRIEREIRAAGLRALYGYDRAVPLVDVKQSQGAQGGGRMLTSAREQTDRPHLPG